MGDNKVETLGQIIRAVRDSTIDPETGKKKNQEKFGIEELGLAPDSAQSNMSQYELDLTQPNFERILKLLNLIGVDLLEIVNKKLSRKGEDAHDPELTHDLKLAAKVLRANAPTTNAVVIAE